MNEPRALLITGASGTVGTALLDRLADWPGPLLMVGRARPARVRSVDRFIACDLSDHAATAETCTHIAAGPPPAALVCAAGQDSRAALGDLNLAAFAECVQVNCLAHLQLLHAATTSRPDADSPLPVVLISSDVIDQQITGTFAYAAVKAAAEQAFRHATADIPPPGLALLLVRLPDIGVPMRAATPGTPPPPSRAGQRPLPILTAAVETIARFVTSSHRTAKVEVWHA
ncbi:SDR family NAD(P)-dependent oxidoreductase [Sphaerisporangium sp. NPDC051011]|uniref:SDR family NAD(P)-dependent oxidoreductase n=1 Tax=Sphaerisporangium sp. NPDC051011 TaxID=3155792 RepID=UPI003407286F